MTTRTLLRPVGLALTAALALLPAAACRGQGASAAAAGPSAKDRTFMAENQLAPGVVSLPSGLQYKVVHSGPAAGAHPTVDDEVKVRHCVMIAHGITAVVIGILAKHPLSPG